MGIVKRKNGSLHQTDMLEETENPVKPRVSFRSVFPVGGDRLAIGSFSRPLLDEECRRLMSAWERSRLPGVEDFEVTAKQVSFVAAEPKVDATWRSIDRLLADGNLAKAS